MTKTIIEQMQNKYHLSGNEIILIEESLRLYSQQIKQMAMVNATTPLQKYLYIKKSQLNNFLKQEGIK